MSRPAAVNPRRGTPATMPLWPHQRPQEPQARRRSFFAFDVHDGDCDVERLFHRLRRGSARQAVGKSARHGVGRDYEDRPDHERRAGMRAAQNDPLEDCIQQDSHQQEV